MERLLELVLSLPVIVVAMYFLPILGIILVFIRAIKYKYNRNYGFNMMLAVCGVVLLLPKLMKYLMDLIKVKTGEIPYLNEILELDIYPKLVDLGKLLIVVGLICNLVSYFSRRLSNQKTASLKEKTTVRTLQAEAQANSKMYGINTETEKVEPKEAELQEFNCPYCAGLNKAYEEAINCKYCGREIMPPKKKM